MRLLSILVLSLLVVGLSTSAYAGTATENQVLLGPNMGSIGVTPPSEMIKVRYTYSPGTAVSGVSSGDILVWDTNSTDYGYAVSICTTSWDEQLFAGIAAEGILTADTTSQLETRNTGLMIIRGYALARCHDSVVAGEGLMPAGVTVSGRAVFVTKGAGIHLSDSGGIVGESLQSKDVGVCLVAPSTTGVAPIWIRP